MADTLTVEVGERLTIADVHDRQIEWRDIVESDADIDIDANDVVAIDTAGLQLLLALKKSVESREREFTWVGVSRDMRAVAEIVDMASLMDLGNE